MSTKKKHKSPRTKSPSVVYKYVIISLIIVLAGAIIANIFLSALGSSRILGISTFLARGGDDSGGNSGSGSSGSDSNDSVDSDSDSNSGSSGNSESSGSGFENNEVRFEVRTSEGDRLKVRTEDDRTRVEIRTGGVKTKFESRDDRTIIKQEKEDAFEDEDEIEIEDEVEVATDGGSFDMPGKHLGAISHFPISIDLATNALIITTPAGTKTVAILPDVAVQNMITKGIISKIGGHVISASGSAEPGDEDGGASGDLENGGVAENIELTVENGSTVYKIHGQKEKRFFGLIPISIDKTVTVSADTGNVESTQLSAFDRFLDLLSI